MEKNSNYYSSWVRKKPNVVLLKMKLLTIIFLAVSMSGGDHKQESIVLASRPHLRCL